MDTLTVDFSQLENERDVAGVPTYSVFGDAILDDARFTLTDQGTTRIDIDYPQKMVVKNTQGGVEWQLTLREEGEDNLVYGNGTVEVWVWLE